jgi:RNA polymerase-binding transcription factor DksA
MNTNLNSSAGENSIEQMGGMVWHRLHAEREDICEALLKEARLVNKESECEPTSRKPATPDQYWHRELLRTRLRKIDDALDRLVSGSYGNCSNCGKWIEDTKLDFDPAIAFCLACWSRMQPMEH